MKILSAELVFSTFSDHFSCYNLVELVSYKWWSIYLLVKCKNPKKKPDVINIHIVYTQFHFV